MTTFKETDLIGNAVIRYLSAHIGFDSGRKLLGLTFSIVVPLVLLAAVTSHESRMLLGSLSEDVTFKGATYRLIGMSFGGDPMVWGFSIVVPFLVAFMGLATRRTVLLVNTVAVKASATWQADVSGLGFAAAVDRSKRIWHLRDPKRLWRGRMLNWSPWAAAALMWLYNAASCGLHDIQPFFNEHYPYKTDHATLYPPVTMRAEVLTLILHERNVAAAVQVKHPRGQIVELETPVPLRKWDAEPGRAPWSFWITRVWAFFYYGVLPFLLAELITLVWGATHFLRASQRWVEAQSRPASGIDINPFESDGFGGLGALADAAIGYLYCVSLFFVLLGFSFLKENALPSWHDYVLMLFFLPAAAMLVLGPTFAVRNLILDAKHSYLRAIASRMKANTDAVLDANSEPGIIERANKEQGALREVYKDVAKLTEWPFDASSLARIAMAVVAPWLPAAVKEVASGVLGG